jgi:hypothetical protein
MTRSIIQKAIIDLRYNGSIDGFAIQKEISDWCFLKLAPGLEEILDKADTGATVKKIDRIELQIDIGSKSDWLSHLSKEITSQLQKKLSELAPASDNDIREQTMSQSFFEVLFYFLQKGYLPWWGTFRNRAEFSAALLLAIKEGINREVKNQLLQVIADTTARDRLIDQLNEEELVLLIAEFYIDQKSELYGLLKDVDILLTIIPEEKRRQVKKRFMVNAWKHAADADSREALRETAMSFAKEIYAFTDNSTKVEYKKFQPSSIIMDEAMGRVEKESEENFFRKITKAEGAKPDDPDASDNQEKDKDPLSESLSTDAIYINNAGLVILAPFLPAFFNKLKLADEDMVLEKESAVNLVTYLATGTEYAAEFELVFAKILCGIDPSVPISTMIAFTDEQKKEAQELLLSAIEYWDALKDTSPQGLRESFLQREGKLSFKDEEWVLQVEQKPYDMLLQNLPWNISMIKLPWMTSILKTEWVY